MEQSPNLDLLRAVAVLLVFVSHLPDAVGPKPPWDLDFLGHFGVTLFFIHTSLVLCGSLARIERRNRQVVRSFHIRRAFRIYPLSILAVLLAFTLQLPPWFHTPFQNPGPLYFWSNLLLFQNLARQLPALGPLWSLPYEVQMYLLLPFVYAWGKKVRNPMVLGISGYAYFWPIISSRAGSAIHPCSNMRRGFSWASPCTSAGPPGVFRRPPIAPLSFY